MRMEEARKLLVNTSYSVAEIAMRVGFRDARYFSQVFKKHVVKRRGPIAVMKLVGFCHPENK